MKTIEELLKNLARPEVMEFGLVTNRLPSVNIGGKFEPVDDEAPSTERLMQMLVTMGGSRHVDSLNDKPVQWTTRLEGVGVIAVAAIMRKDVVQARFTVQKREPAGPTREAAAAPTPTPLPVSSPMASAPPAAQPPRELVVPPPRQVIHPTPSSPMQPVPLPAHARTSERTSISAPLSAPPSAPAGAGRPSQSAQRSVPLVESRVEARVVPAPVPAPQSVHPKVAPTVPSAAPPRPSIQPASGAMTSAAPAPLTAKKEISPAPPQVVSVAPPAPVTPSPAQPVASSPLSATPVTPSVAPTAPSSSPSPTEPDDEPWQDDDEPTLQTMSPMEMSQRPGPKPARTAPGTGAGKGAERRIPTPTSVDAVDADAIRKAAAEKVPAAAPSPAAPAVATPLSPVVEPTKSVVPPSNRSAESARMEAAKAKPVSAEHPALRTSERPSARLSVAPPKVPSVVPAAPERSSGSATSGERSERQRVEGTAALESFLAMAVAARASDLIVAARRPVFLRVATDLLPRTQEVPPEHVERISKELVPVRLREAFERDGSCDFVAEHPAHGRFRVNVSRHRGGLKIHFRVIPREVASLAALGLPEALASGLRQPRGLVLVTGPASQGKTTTLAALVDWLNRETQRHVVTIEEPIEHLHLRKKALISQREVGVHVPSRTRAIRATLKEDADVIVIGHMCDADTIRHALIAAESGRLVLASMCTSSAAKTIDSIIEAFPAMEREWVRARLASTLRLVANQRLVPSTDRTRLHAAVEILPWSVGLYRILRDGRTHQIPALQQRAPAPAVRLDEALAELVRAQKVTAETAKQYALSPSDIPAQNAWPSAAARKP